MNNKKNINFKHFITNPKFKHGSHATLITLIGIIIVVLIYIISLKLNDKYNLSLDMTSQKIFQLTDESKNYIKKLDKPINIYVLSSKQDFTSNEYFNQVSQVLKMYEKHGKNIKVNYIDIIKNPMFVNNYPSENLNQSNIIIQLNNQYKVLSIQDLFNIESDYMSQRVTSSKAEQAMTSAIMTIASDSKYKVSILTGHEESSADSLKKLLEDNLYQVSSLNLITNNIPNDVSMIIIASPSKDYTETEIKKIDEFLENKGEYGKNLLYFADIKQDVLPNIESLLSKWDISIEPAIAFDSSRQTQLAEFSAVVDYTDNNLFESLIQKNTSTVFVNCKPVKFTNENSQLKTHSSLISFSEQAVGLKYTKESIESPDNASINGPFSAIVKSSKTKKLNSNISTSSVIVSGSLTSIDQALLFNIPVGNSEVYLKIIDNACGKNDGIKILDKELRGQEMDISKSTSQILKIIFIALIPSAVLGGGLLVWSIRRHK